MPGWSWLPRTMAGARRTTSRRTHTIRWSRTFEGETSPLGSWLEHERFRVSLRHRTRKAILLRAVCREAVYSSFWRRWQELSYCSGTGAPTNGVSKNNVGALRKGRQPHRPPERVRREGAARLRLPRGPAFAAGSANGRVGRDENLGRQDYRFRPGVRRGRIPAHLRPHQGARAYGARAQTPRRVHAEAPRSRENHGRLQGRRRSSGRQASCGEGGDTGRRRSRGDRAGRGPRRRTSEAASGIRPGGPRGRGSRIPPGRVRSPAEPRGGRSARGAGPRAQGGATERDLRARRTPRRTLRYGRGTSAGARDSRRVSWSA